MGGTTLGEIYSSLVAKYLSTFHTLTDGSGKFGALRATTQVAGANTGLLDMYSTWPGRVIQDMYRGLLPEPRFIKSVEVFYLSMSSLVVKYHSETLSFEPL